MCSPRRSLTHRYGRTHRLLGLALTLYLLLGMVDARRVGGFTVVPPSELWLYDVGLSLLGASAALSAARDFGPSHRKVKNEASGVLDTDATVTQSEMVEHSFYQLLNLVQISFLHAVPWFAPGTAPGSAPGRTALALLATLPWLFRANFPVNSFSKNYELPGVGGRTPLIRLLYRLKKYQYLLYKHCLLHGLNASVAVEGMHATAAAPGLASTQSFRLYWMCLNTAYVMEFYMQTLVKRGYLSQSSMLAMQQTLMLVSTTAALEVLEAVRLLPALLSFALNMTRRGREVSNFGIVLVCTWLLPPWHIV